MAYQIAVTPKISKNPLEIKVEERDEYSIGKIRPKTSTNIALGNQGSGQKVKKENVFTRLANAKKETEPKRLMGSRKGSSNIFRPARNDTSRNDNSPPR